MIQAVRDSIAEDLMSRGVETIASNSTVIDAARRISSKNVHYLIVIDAQRHVVGVVTENDILEFLNEPLDRQQSGQGWDGEVTNLITQELITVQATTSIGDLTWTLVINRIDCLPVVDSNECLIGAVGVRELVKHLSSGVPSRSDTGFEFFSPSDKDERPSLPAFFRCACGTLVVPVSSLEGVNLDLRYARLGYDGSDGRIAVKLVSEQAPGDQRVSRERINRDGVYLAIPANEFVEHFNVNRRIRAYEVACHAGDIFLIPRQ